MSIPVEYNYGYIKKFLEYHLGKMDNLIKIVKDNPEVFKTCYSLEEDLQEVKDKIKQALEMNFGSVEDE